MCSDSTGKVHRDALPTPTPWSNAWSTTRLPPDIAALLRDDAAYQAALDTGFETRAFYDLADMVAGFSRTYPDDVQQGNPGHRSTRRGIANAVMNEVVQRLESDFNYADQNEEPEEPGPIRDGEEDSEAGRSASFRAPAL